MGDVLPPAELEGYLSCQAELSTARSEADAFVAGLPWLTAAQRAELAGRYVQERLRLTHRFAVRLSEHCRTLEAAHAARDRELRQRRLCAAVCALTAVASLYAATLLMLRP